MTDKPLTGHMIQRLNLLEQQVQILRARVDSDTEEALETERRVAVERLARLRALEEAVVAELRAAELGDKERRDGT